MIYYLVSNPKLPNMKAQSAGWDGTVRLCSAGGVRDAFRPIPGWAAACYRESRESHNSCTATPTVCIVSGAA